MAGGQRFFIASLTKLLGLRANYARAACIAYRHERKGALAFDPWQGPTCRKRQLSEANSLYLRIFSGLSITVFQKGGKALGRQSPPKRGCPWGQRWSRDGTGLEQSWGRPGVTLGQSLKQRKNSGHILHLVHTRKGVAGQHNAQGDVVFKQAKLLQLFCAFQ